MAPGRWEHPAPQGERAFSAGSCSLRRLRHEGPRPDLTPHHPGAKHSKLKKNSPACWLLQSSRSATAQPVAHHNAMLLQQTRSCTDRLTYRTHLSSVTRVCFKFVAKNHDHKNGGIWAPKSRNLVLHGKMLKVAKVSTPNESVSMVCNLSPRRDLGTVRGTSRIYLSSDASGQRDNEIQSQREEKNKTTTKRRSYQTQQATERCGGGATLRQIQYCYPDFHKPPQSTKKPLAKA